jgi:glycosyltransferase involved in cell wall biosynthesis
MRLKVVIPVFNEKTELTPLVAEALTYDFIDEIVIVDDGSKKRVKNVKGVTVLRHAVNLGKGSAMKTGAVYAFSKGATHVVFMDGDGQHLASDLPKFHKKLKLGFDIVLGSRRVGRNQPLIRSLGNKFASRYIQIMFGHKFRDILSGFRAISHRAFVLTQWDSKRYGVETEMAARFGMMQDRLSICEISIGTIYMDKYKGVTIMDALNILFETIWWKLTWGYN